MGLWKINEKKYLNVDKVSAITELEDGSYEIICGGFRHFINASDIDKTLKCCHGLMSISESLYIPDKEEK